MGRVLPLFNMGITAALAIFFLAIWLLRRSETSYGWYSLALLGWAGYSLNLVATRPWPFATSDGWARATLSMLILFAASYCMFVIRFLERRRSEEHTSELQSLMRISYAVFCLKQKIASVSTTSAVNDNIKT